jgi:hypothetical protein
MSYYRLHNHTSQWSSQPKQGKVFHIGTKSLQDARSITILQRKAHLDTQESHTHIDNLYKAKAGFCYRFIHQF